MKFIDIDPAEVFENWTRGYGIKTAQDAQDWLMGNLSAYCSMLYTRPLKEKKKTHGFSPFLLNETANLKYQWVCEFGVNDRYATVYDRGFPPIGGFYDEYRIFALPGFGCMITKIHHRSPVRLAFLATTAMDEREITESEVAPWLISKVRSALNVDEIDGIMYELTTLSADDLKILTDE